MLKQTDKFYLREVTMRVLGGRPVDLHLTDNTNDPWYPKAVARINANDATVDVTARINASQRLNPNDVKVAFIQVALRTLENDHGRL